MRTCVRTLPAVSSMQMLYMRVLGVQVVDYIGETAHLVKTCRESIKAKTYERVWYTKLERTFDRTELGRSRKL